MGILKKRLEQIESALADIIEIMHDNDYVDTPCTRDFGDYEDHIHYILDADTVAKLRRLFNIFRKDKNENG